jgi:hypothetical protein
VGLQSSERSLAQSLIAPAPYGSDPFSYDFEASLANANGSTRTFLSRAERQERWEAGLSLDGSKLDPAVARHLARRGARPDIPDGNAAPAADEDAVQTHRVEHLETHASIPSLPVSARQLERHRKLYGRAETEYVEVSGEGLDKRERPLPADWNLRKRRVLKRDGKSCQRCSRTLGARQLSAHHIVPRADGGSDSDANLITLCTLGRKENVGLSCHDWVEVQTDRGKLAPNAAAIRGSWESSTSRPSKNPAQPCGLKVSLT